ncbi:lipoate-protein ligase [Schizosaccharomyces cryophilus OY26]|uniref:Octanoyltransferase n=1 Tax=Schizosaccharomyces cryophilus (strain OY26 / ATCC MYA-4695 / CBS 11777 / NBRC 106824 / NRRL Y48691) TaxID=653667 RepID=S9X5W7_SCHCR|nr:lipoate-protein ligase [Schizosaccharomyces cryophilus OY26]EPY52482.1 lipoate-protein ligase [Schizosaccharomyces cryophilus OY26]
MRIEKSGFQHISFLTSRFPKVDYLRLGECQQHFVQKWLDFKSNKCHSPPQPTILTAQVCPVYTLGRRDTKTNFHNSIDGVKVIKALRGGQTTYHGPGQLLVYPILDLSAFHLSPRKYVSKLEEAIIQTCRHFGMTTAHTNEHTGVWLTDDEKIAAIGIHLRRYITSHGLALNVSTDLEKFKKIVACGLQDKTTTSFQAQGVNVELKTVEQVLVQHLIDALLK